MIAKADFVKHFHKLMKNALCRKKTEIGRKRIKLDLIDKIDTQRVKIGKSKVTVVDKSAGSQKFNLYECNQFLIATSLLECPTTKHYKKTNYSHFGQRTKQKKQKNFSDFMLEKIQ